jgi:hypothetical protein
MDFDFDAFAGALRTLSKAFDETADRTGIPREALTLALCRHATNQRDKEATRLWKSAQSDDELGKWIYKQAMKFNTANEGEILQLADEIPGRIRRNLIEIAKSIPASQGGKQPKLDFVQRWQARKQVKELNDKGIPKDKAYQQVAKRMGASAHTVRRICDERERQRSRQASRKVAFAIH